MSDKTYSQFQQDLHVCKFYENLKGGYFVDIGAFDGISISNSYKIEKELAWHGICVEPQPDVFDRLLENRNCININKALTSSSGETLEFSKGRGGNSVLSGLTKFLDGWGRNAAMRGDRLEMVSSTLNEVLDDNNAPPFIHYLSLDTEGSELEILKGVDLGRYTFGYLCIEHNNVVDRRNAIRTLLEKNGYCFYRENHCDDDYFHRSLIGGTYFFNNDQSRPIVVTLDDQNQIVAKSDYWPDQKGLFRPETLEIEFESMGSRKVSAFSIARSEKNQWRKVSL